MRDHRIKLALFDFCETLVNFQTADAYVHFVRGQKHDIAMKMKELLRQILAKTMVIFVLQRVLKKPLHKQLVLWQLKGLHRKDLDIFARDYYRQIIKKSFINKILSVLKGLQNQGYKVYLVSGGYDIYLNNFVREFQLDGMISTRILFVDDVCAGKFDGIDCLGENKIKLLEKYFEDTLVDRKGSIAFSDSISDLPLLNWCGTGVVVSRETGKRWVAERGMQEFIWKNCKK